MWGRRQGGSATKPGTVTTSADSPRALSTVDELLRRADWERMSDTDRAALRGAFPPFPGAGGTGPGDPVNLDIDPAASDWIAALVARGFQLECAQLIQTWLTDASPESHLFIGGSPARGRRSLVASLARQAMARRPAPLDYCYVPEPSAMGQAYRLSLPGGVGEGFTKAIDRALRRVTAQWTPDTSNEPSPTDLQSARTTLIAESFAPVQAPEFASASAYVGQLRASFESLASSGADLPTSYDDMPTWLARAPSPDDMDSQPAGGQSHGAPVVVGTLIREKLDDLLMRANGGVLILLATDPLVVDGAWLTLSAALSSRSLRVRAGWPALPLTVRVVLVGDNSAYTNLANGAGEFARLFRYEAWCNASAPWTPNAEAAYAALADAVAQRHGLPAFDAAAVARLVEEGARRGDGLNRSYLSTDLLWIHDLSVEAGQSARARGAAATGGADVVGALQRRRMVQGANARRVREAILSGQAITPTAGSAIGQINGLGIIEVHPTEGTFAVPTRISATVSAGRDERLLDIEREADQADADHVRGEMTIEGYLAHRFGQERPINLVARIRFEQEHGTTGGDSASGAILFALLSALAQVPIRYSYAVTGAVGQYGEMQPIGGVNTKIEGFWELCRQRRAQGEQPEGGYGVLIPAVNARDLMLRDEVADAIAREGWFHIWPINTVDDALPILTGAPAAEIAARVAQRLQRFHEIGAQGSSAR